MKNIFYTECVHSKNYACCEIPRGEVFILTSEYWTHISVKLFSAVRLI